MSEVLLWILAVFAVLAGPPLIAVLWELRREKREADQRARQRRFEETRGGQALATPAGPFAEQPARIERQEAVGGDG